MMRGSVDNVLQPVPGDHIRIVNEHRPNVHGDEEGEVEVFLNGEDVGEEVVGERLEVTVDWVECVCGEGRGYDPLVVWLVDVFVDEGMVLQSVNPVNAIIGADEESNHNRISKTRKTEKKCTHTGTERKNHTQP